MGGHALKKVIASRVNLIQYNIIKENIKTQIEKKFNKDVIEIEFIIDVPGKSDFGDIDILYKILDPDRWTNSVDAIKNIFNPVEIVSNGPVCSFAYEIPDKIPDEKKYFQVDMIRCDDLNQSQFYFSYGDLGGIIGRICQHIGITFGSAGLWVNPNPETIHQYLTKYNKKIPIDSNLISRAQFKNIILTTNSVKICEYLGLDWVRWTRGFKSQHEIFDWICQSKWFRLDSFRAMDNQHRHRANTRQMYQDFLDFIFIDEPKFAIEKANSTKYTYNNLQLESIEYFNKLNGCESLDEQIDMVILDLERKIKFNGKKFIIRGIKGQEIGTHTEKFKKYIEIKFNTQFDKWLDSIVSETVDQQIEIFMSI